MPESEAERRAASQRMIAMADAALASADRIIKSGKPDERLWLTGSELFTATHPPATYLVENLIPQGSILFAGRPKAGKSWFALGLAIAVVTGDHFMGREVNRGEVLYLALEDNERRLSKRLQQLAGDHRAEELTGFTASLNWSKGILAASEIDAWCYKHPNARLVIVDTLKMIKEQADPKKNGYDVDYDSLAALTGVANHRKITILIVHHTRKAESDDPFDTVSGTLGLNAAVDTIFVLQRSKEPRVATLHGRGRELEEDVERSISLHPNGLWRDVGTAEAGSLRSERMAVLEELRDSETGLRTFELAKRLGKRSLPSLRKILNSMQKDRHLIKKGHYWCLPPVSL